MVCDPKFHGRDLERKLVKVYRYLLPSQGRSRSALPIFADGKRPRDSHEDQGSLYVLD